MSYEKLTPKFDLNEERINLMKQIIPEAFADGKINWDSFKEALGEYLEEDEKEHYSFTWPGKKERSIAPKNILPRLESIIDRLPLKHWIGGKMDKDYSIKNNSARIQIWN
jgi:hypothetical protein